MGLASGIIGALGDMFRSQAEREQAIRVLKETPTTSAGLLFDPLLGAATNEALLGLGTFNEATLRSTSPLAQLIQQVEQDPTIGAERKRDVKNALAGLIASGGRNYDTDQGEVIHLARSVLRRAGFDPSSFLTAQKQFEQRYQAELPAIREAAQRISESRRQAQFNLAELVADIEPITSERFAQERASQSEQLRQIIDSVTQEQRRDALEIAAATGGNVGRVLEGLERTRQQQLIDLPTTATQRALQLLGGEQGLTAANLTNLQGAFGNAQNQAATLAATRAGGLTSAAQVAGAQATALASLSHQARLAEAASISSGFDKAAEAARQMSAQGIISSVFGSGSGSGPGVESAAGLAALSCHGAAVYFGWGTPDWFYAWRWIAYGWQGEDAARFRGWYRRNSERLAGLLERHEKLRVRLEPFFVWARDQGKTLET